jgi:hypothetical protein
VGGWRRARIFAAALIVVAAGGCKPEPALVAGSVDSHEFTARVRRAIPAGESEVAGEQLLSTQGFDCARTDTLQSEEEDTLQSAAAPDEPGTEYLTCDYVRGRRWGENTRRRYLVVLYIREQKIDRVFAVTHLREVH